jgi:6-pyruvoyltetrahydropterin/6-carboxytetrahydropterin synthase
MSTGIEEKKTLGNILEDVNFGSKRAWVGKRFHFDAAHFLPFHRGKCKNLHGHRWFIDLELEGPINEEGMVIDFGLLSSFMDFILEEFDHHQLNEVIANPTAENLCMYLTEKIKNKWPISYPYLHLTSLKIWETETSFAMVKPGLYLRNE